jgi:hypothetical protein
MFDPQQVAGAEGHERCPCRLAAYGKAGLRGQASGQRRDAPHLLGTNASCNKAVVAQGPAQELPQTARHQSSTMATKHSRRNTKMTAIPQPCPTSGFQHLLSSPPSASRAMIASPPNHQQHRAGRIVPASGKDQQSTDGPG